MHFGRPVTITEAMVVTSNVAETLAAYNAGTTYASGAQVRKAKGGVQHGFTSAQNSNTGHDPATDDGTWWSDDGPTNRYLMFDGSRGTQTANADSIEVEIDLSGLGLINAVAVQNVDADEIRIVQTDALEGDVYDETFSMISNSGITDPYAFSFTPITRIADLTMIELLPYADSTLTLEVLNPGGTAKCGEVLPAWVRDYGGTRWGGTVAIQDFSVKEDDGFGGFDVTERAFRKTAELEILVANAMIDTVVDDLSRLRATPILWIGDKDYGALSIYGFVKDWTAEFGPTTSLLRVQIEGLA